MLVLIMIFDMHIRLTYEIELFQGCFFSGVYIIEKK